MLRKAGIALAGVIALVPILGTAAADEKTPSIKEIMKTVASSKAEKGLCAKCADAGKSANWDEAQKLAKTLTECCANLPKTKCPKGDAASWEKLTKQYAEQSKAIAKAADDKDAKAFGDAISAFTRACSNCHMNHKGK